MAVTTWTAGEVLTAADLNDTFASKLDLAGGKILQIVRATDSTSRTTSSTSYVDVTGMSVTITPEASDSAIIVIASCRYNLLDASSDAAFGYVQITDASNNALNGAEDVIAAINSGGATDVRIVGMFTAFGYSTPATTSATTYKLRFKQSSATTYTLENANSTGQIYAIEVSA